MNNGRDETAFTSFSEVIYLFLYVSIKPFKHISSVLWVHSFFHSFIFPPEAVLADPCKDHDQATDGRGHSHVGEVVRDYFLHMGEACGCGRSYFKFKSEVEHRGFANSTARELLLEIVQELHGVLDLGRII